MSKNADILESLIEEDFGLQTKDGSRWGKSEEHSSLVLDKDKGIFYWNAQGIVGDPLVYLTQVRKLSFLDAREYLKRFDYQGTYVYTIQTKKEDVVVYPKLVDVFYEQGLDKRDYFYRRGLKDSTIDRFQLGWYNDYNMVPFFDNGAFRNFQMRQDNPSKRIKGFYRNIGPLMFNPDVLKTTDDVYYVEGPVDAMILVQNGLPAISTNCGGGYLPEWYSKFIKQKKINIVFDNDDAGRKEAKKLAKFLGVNRCKIYTFEDSGEPGYDPVDYFRDNDDVDSFVELITNGSKYVFELPGQDGRRGGRGNSESTGKFR